LVEVDRAPGGFVDPLGCEDVLDGLGEDGRGICVVIFLEKDHDLIAVNSKYL
jgi:hypothetical protein